MLNDQSMMAGTPMGQGMPGQPSGGGQQAGPIPMGPPMEDPNTPVALPGQSDEQSNMIDEMFSSKNIAEKLAKKIDKDSGQPMLELMASRIMAGVRADAVSREGWMKENREWLEMAMLVRKSKSWPWTGAANIKYPLIATAAMQFSARAYPSLVPSDGKIVKVEVTQMNAQEDVYDRAKRVAEHMSWQVREEIPDWEENMDKLLMTIAITGLCFKKTYHDAVEGVHRSDLVYPENLILNYNAKSLEQAYRKTEVQEFNNNEIVEKVRAGEFLDVDLGEPTTGSKREKEPVVSIEPLSIADGSNTHMFYQVHTFWDIDGDGYEEPYVITIHERTEQIVRIIARYDISGVELDSAKKVIRIKPLEYYTDFPFIPNPDGSVYAMGFGLLLGPLNEAVNSIINQLIDSGTLHNLQSGFIAKGLRLKIGDTALAPGEWKPVNATGESLKDSIFPLPTKEPSSVLHALLSMLIQSGNQLASIAEIMVGKMPGQNTPATTTQEAVQQGMAVFTAIYKRVFRSLKKEFKKLYRLNRITSSVKAAANAMAGIDVAGDDYNFPDWMIVPGADPVGDSSTVKMQKNQFVTQNLLPLGTINPMGLTQQTLKDIEYPNAQAIIMQPQPQEDPKAKALEMKAQIDQQKAQADMALKEKELEIKEKLAALDMQMKEMELKFKERELELKQQEHEQKMMMDQQMAQQKAATETQKMQLDLQATQVSTQQELKVNEALGQQKIQQGEQAFKQKSQQADQSFKQKQQQQKAQASQKGNKPKGK